MPDELTYKRLRDLCREEKSQPGLVKVGQEFYSSVEKFLNDNFSKIEEKPSVLQMREFENATAVVREISLIRQQKILFRALRGKGAGAPEEDMTREEYGIYDRFCGIITEENARLETLLSRFESKAPEKRAERRQEREAAAERKVKKLRFLKDVTAYVGMNKETVGPFRTGEEGALPIEEADFLLKQKLAEMAE